MSLSIYAEPEACEDAAVRVAPELESRLTDPQVAHSLAHLLDHIDVINLVVDSLDELLANSESILDNVVASFKDAKTTADAIKPVGAAGAGAIDPGKTAVALTEMASALPDLAPSLVKVGQSGVLDSVSEPGMVHLIGAAGRAASAADADPNPVAAGGVLPLLRALKDPDIARGVSHLLTIARHLGKQLET